MSNSSTICLNRQAAKLHSVTLDEVILMLSIWQNLDFDTAEKKLIVKGYITAKRSKGVPVGWVLTQKGAELLDAVIIDSEKQTEPVEKLNDLAARLKEVFPKGKKEGTNYYWAEGVALIVRRLKLFFKKYGNTYTDDQIVNAAKKYVEGFNGHYQYMRLLKYFIFKESIGAAGEVEGSSELINYIENAGQEDTLKENWTSTLS